MRSSLIDIACEAGRAILKIYDQSEIHSTQKDDESPLTDADMASHHLISKQLQDAFPFPVFSEEDPVDFEVRKNWDAFWLVDPLDGTKNFIARDGEFTVNIALISGTEPVLGVVHIPVQGVTYSAVKDGGAWKTDDNCEVKISNTSARQGAELVCAVSSFHNTPESQTFCDHYGIKHMRKLGSSLKLCKLAEGEIDVYPRFNGTKEWDTAASQCIIEAAGCKIIDIETGKALVYNKEDYRNNYFIAFRQDLDFTWPV